MGLRYARLGYLDEGPDVAITIDVSKVNDLKGEKVIVGGLTYGNQ